jgi:hypothetical protein
MDINLVISNRLDEEVLEILYTIALGLGLAAAMFNRHWVLISRRSAFTEPSSFSTSTTCISYIHNDFLVCQPATSLLCTLRILVLILHVSLTFSIWSRL